MAWVLRLLVIGLGLMLVYGGLAEWVSWLRARRRSRRVTGVFVGSMDATPIPGRAQRSGTFQFTTEDGQVFTGTSSFSSPRGPRVGKRVTIVYDPADPEEADVAWVKTFKLVLSPVLALVGLVIVYGGIVTWRS